MDLIETALSKGSDSWPKLEPILKTCLESTDVNFSLKILGLYDEGGPGAGTANGRVIRGQVDGTGRP